jgi:RND family efflux transporter MFP subunit
MERRVVRKRLSDMPWRPIALIVVMAVAVALAAFILIGPSNDSARATPPLRVQTALAERVDGYQTSRQFVGRIQATRRTALGFDLPGRVESVLPDDGDVIEAGSLIARLETDRLEAREAALKAGLEAARAQASQASNALERLRSARSLDPEAVGQLEFENARHTLDAARAEAQRIEQQMRATQLDIEKSALHAPFPAEVARRHVDSGAVISPGAAVVTLIEKGRREARIGLSPNAAETLVVGTSYRLESAGTPFEARLSRLLPVEDGRLSTVEAVFEVGREGAGLRPGRLVTVSAEIQHDEAGYWLPLSALTASVRGLWAVYLAEPVTGGAMHRLRRVEVEVLHERDSRVFIRGALPGQALVVTAGLQRLTPGLLVRLAEEPET